MWPEFPQLWKFWKIWSTIFSNEIPVNCTLLHKFSLFYTILALFHNFFHIFTKKSKLSKNALVTLIAQGCAAAALHCNLCDQIRLAFLTLVGWLPLGITKILGQNGLFAKLQKNALLQRYTATRSGQLIWQWLAGLGIQK